MASHRSPDFVRLIGQLAQELKARKLPFMLIGGQAVLLHGESRLTEDVDATLGVSPDRLPAVLEACKSLGLEPLPTDVEAFVRQTFVLPAAEPETGIRIDLIFSTTPYEAQAIKRAVLVELGSVMVPFATAEDLILHKLFAGRPRDLEDAAGVVRRQAKGLDWDYLKRWVGEFSVIPGREHLPDRLAGLQSEPRDT